MEQGKEGQGRTGDGRIRGVGRRGENNGMVKYTRGRVRNDVAGTSRVILRARFTVHCGLWRDESRCIDKDR